jgi:hypothetical protein
MKRVVKEERLVARETKVGLNALVTAQNIISNREVRVDVLIIVWVTVVGFVRAKGRDGFHFLLADADEDSLTNLHDVKQGGRKTNTPGCMSFGVN